MMERAGGGVSTNCCMPGGVGGTGDEAAAAAAQLAATAAACGDTNVFADIDVMLIQRGGGSHAAYYHVLDFDTEIASHINLLKAHNSLVKAPAGYSSCGREATVLNLNLRMQSNKCVAS